MEKQNNTKTLRTIDIVQAMGVLGTAKLSKMDDKEKFALIRAMKALKPAKTAYDDFVADAREKLKAAAHDDLLKQADQWRQKHAGQKPADLDPAALRELEELNTYFNDYNRRVEECVKEEAERETTVQYAPLTEEAFARLLASNDGLDAEKALLLSEVLCA